MFHLVVISLEGFPEEFDLKELINENWELPKGRLVNRTIEMIEYDKFINQLKENNLSVSIYKKMRGV